MFDGLLLGVGVGGALSTVLGIVLCQSFDFQLLGHGKEVVEVLLSHVDLPVVHKVEDGLEVIVLDALQVEEWMLVRILLEHRPEEGRAGGQDQLVGLDVARAAAQRHVEQIFVVADVSEGAADVGLKIIPAEAKFVCSTARHSVFLLLFFQFSLDSLLLLNFFISLYELLDLNKQVVFRFCCKQDSLFYSKQA